MRKLFVTILLVMATCHINAQQAKYVFYFIGDGMGLNQVNTTEMYLAEVEGKIGIKPLLFPSFPVASHANSHSSSNSITDSAAGGTALATGVKTYNNAMGVDADKNPVESFAEKAKKAGKRVGITTSVSIDHATPGSQYAHEPYRNMYYEIATWLPKSNFDFFAGSGFLKPDKTVDGKDAPNLFPIFEQAGYTLARGINEYKAKRNEAKKMILMEKTDADQASLRYAIDRQPGDLTLAEITESAIDFLMKENAKKVVKALEIQGACNVQFGLHPQTDEFVIIEVNPRIQGTFECVEKAYGINMLEAHIQACQGEIIEIGNPKYYAYKKIVYSPTRMKYSQIDLDNIYDLPHTGSITEKDEPLLTIIDKSNDFEKLCEKVESASQIVDKAARINRLDA